MHFSLFINIFGLTLDIEGASAALTLGGIFSVWVSFSARVKGSPFISAGWEQGIKGAVEVSLAGLTLGAAIPTLRAQYLS
jgi:hypothetical protein